MGDSKQRDLIKRFVETFREYIETWGEFRGQYFVIIKNKEKIRDLVVYLKSYNFDHLQMLTCVDYYKRRENFRFEVVYQFYSISEKISLRIRVLIPEDDLEIDSIVDLYPVSNFFEREIFDMFGIKFRGHPNLKRILLPENWRGHPLRKDYPLQPQEKPEEFIKLVELKDRLGKHGIK